MRNVVVPEGARVVGAEMPPPIFQQAKWLTDALALVFAACASRSVEFLLEQVVRGRALVTHTRHVHIVP
jgi:hypothetical protein